MHRLSQQGDPDTTDAVAHHRTGDMDQTADERRKEKIVIVRAVGDANLSAVINVGIRRGRHPEIGDIVTRTASCVVNHDVGAAAVTGGRRRQEGAVTAEANIVIRP